MRDLWTVLDPDGRYYVDAERFASALTQRIPQLRAAGWTVERIRQNTISARQGAVWFIAPPR